MGKGGEHDMFLTLKIFIFEEGAKLHVHDKALRALIDAHGV